MSESYKNIIEEVDNKIEQVRTKSLDMSFNELLDMYINQELVISPDYQRLFRWDIEKQSRFIESLILELPIPPVFVIELQEGQYELIDGLQRISSYLHFRGTLISKSEQTPVEPFKLIGCDVLEELNGLSYDELPKSIQIKLKRNFIRVEVLRKESDTRLRYHMFKRLNSGGEILSEQEIRNCTIRLLDSKINDFIVELSNNVDYVETIKKVKDSDIEKMYDKELILRFFALKNNLDNYAYPFDEFLTEYMEGIAKGDYAFDYDKEKKIFESTFKAINSLFGSDAFSNLLSSDRIKENFVTYYYEAFSLGIVNYAEKINNCSPQEVIRIRERLNEIKKGEEIVKYRTGTKSNVQSRIDLIISNMREVYES